jgi:hypothetical protein
MLVYEGSLKFFPHSVKLSIGGLQQIAVSWVILVFNKVTQQAGCFACMNKPLFFLELTKNFLKSCSFPQKTHTQKGRNSKQQSTSRWKPCNTFPLSKDLVAIFIMIHKNNNYNNNNNKK